MGEFAAQGKLELGVAMSENRCANCGMPIEWYAKFQVWFHSESNDVRCYPKRGYLPEATSIISALEPKKEEGERPCGI